MMRNVILLNVTGNSVKIILLLFIFWSTLTLANAVQTVSVADFELEYQEAGKGEHLVLLEAGAGASLSDWDPVFAGIAEKARVIRYSRVGNGNSTAIKRHFTSMDYARHVAGFLEKLAISEAVLLVAHSYGGSIARDFSASYPNKVKGLLLLDPSSEHDVDIMRAMDLDTANEQIAQIKLDDMANGMSNNYLDFWSKRPLPDYPQIRDIPVAVIASVKKVKNPPNLFFTDEGRKRWGAHWQQWARSFPQGRAILTDKSGHFVQFDQPDLVLAEIENLINALKEQSD